jgi:hypothetical protein
MAIFIDNVMDASVRRKQQERGVNTAQMELALKELIALLINKKRVKSVSIGETARKAVQNRVTHLLDFHDGKDGDILNRITQIDNQFKEMDEEDVIITKDNFEAWLEEPAFLNMLDDLDIGTSNKSQLFDVLDCDLSGELEVAEVISGLMKLRGPSDKSDAVASLLGIRYMTTKLDEVHKIIENSQDIMKTISEPIRSQKQDKKSVSGKSGGISRNTAYPNKANRITASNSVFSSQADNVRNQNS